MDYTTIFEWVGRLVILVLVISGIRALFRRKPDPSLDTIEHRWQRLKREYALDEVTTDLPIMGINRAERFLIILDGTACRKIPLASLVGVEIRQDGQFVVGIDRAHDQNAGETRNLAFGANGFVRASASGGLTPEKPNRLDLLIFSDSVDWGFEVNFWERYEDPEYPECSTMPELSSKAASLKEWYSKLAAVIQSMLSEQARLAQDAAA